MRKRKMKKRRKNPRKNNKFGRMRIRISIKKRKKENLKYSMNNHSMRISILMMRKRIGMRTPTIQCCRLLGIKT